MSDSSSSVAERCETCAAGPRIEYTEFVNHAVRPRHRPAHDEPAVHLFEGFAVGVLLQEDRLLTELGSAVTQPR